MDTERYASNCSSLNKKQDHLLYLSLKKILLDCIIFDYDARDHTVSFF